MVTDESLTAAGSTRHRIFASHRSLLADLKKKDLVASIGPAPLLINSLIRARISAPIHLRKPVGSCREDNLDAGGKT